MLGAGSNPIGGGWTPLLSLGEDGVILVDSGTVTAAAGAATLHKASGTVTTESLSTAAGALYNLTLTNNRVTATSRVFVEVNNNTNTNGHPCKLTVTPQNGSVVVTVKNVHATDSFNGRLDIRFWVTE